MSRGPQYVRADLLLAEIAKWRDVGFAGESRKHRQRSYDKPGVDAVGEVFANFFEDYGIEVERLPRDVSGDIFRAHVPGIGNLPVVLMGHRDTVFPRGEAARRPFTIKDGRAFGPGVMDMKGGLVMNAFVLAAFKKFGGNSTPLVALLPQMRRLVRPSHVE
jgi:glutamate carboxypeptidase